MTESASLFSGGKSAKNRRPLESIAANSHFTSPRGEGKRGAMWSESGILLPDDDDGGASPLLSPLSWSISDQRGKGLRIASRLPPTCLVQIGNITWIKFG